MQNLSKHHIFSLVNVYLAIKKSVNYIRLLLNVAQGISGQVFQPRFKIGRPKWLSCSGFVDCCKATKTKQVHRPIYGMQQIVSNTFIVQVTVTQRNIIGKFMFIEIVNVSMWQVQIMAQNLDQTDSDQSFNLLNVAQEILGLVFQSQFKIGQTVQRYLSLLSVVVVARSLQTLYCVTLG